ncbi:MAG: excinuclease ABC subunit UvrC [Actinomycetota bacterium]|nr:excinuclease ABC subunit UvrC [Actinomycetota bacterium]
MPRNPTATFRPEPGAIPAEPGCYLWRDRHDRVIYVGKAKSLRSRLASYFGGWSGIAQRTRAMLEAAARVEWIVCDNEVEALHLEYNLIKRHRPRYNVRYTDDKSYPYLAVTVQDDVPRAMVRRNPRKDGTRYFGPYAHAYAIRETLDLLLRVFPVRTCSQGVFDRCRRNDRPCLLYHIGRCSAPCVGHVSHTEHRELVRALIDFLSGRTDEVLAELSERMASEAAKLNFEAAARLRDQLVAARRILERQAMVTGRREDFDAVHFHADELEAAFQAFFVRNGRVVGRKGWTVDRVEDLDAPALVGRFLLQLAMERDEDIPREVLVPVEPEDRDALEQLLTGLRRDARGDARSGRVAVRVPRRGDKRAFLDTVRENAVEAFHQHRLKRAKDFNARSQALHELQEALGLPEAPLRIECYDISTLQGTDSVASMVVMEDGLPRKSEYRRFKIRGVEGQDDFAMMQEVITRRFRRLLDDAARPMVDDRGAARAFAYPPSLVVIDGGRGQLNAARRALDALGVQGVDVCALAKRLEEVFLPDREEPVVLPRASEALYLIQRIRDEAHRFAVTYHRSLRGRRMTESAFDDVPGIGPARRAALLAHFGSVKRVSEASPDELACVEGISEELAARLYDRLHLPAAAR